MSKWHHQDVQCLRCTATKAKEKSTNAKPIRAIGKIVYWKRQWVRLSLQCAAKSAPPQSLHIFMKMWFYLSLNWALAYKSLFRLVIHASTDVVDKTSVCDEYECDVRHNTNKVCSYHRPISLNCHSLRKIQIYVFRIVNIKSKFQSNHKFTKQYQITTLWRRNWFTF